MVQFLPLFGFWKSFQFFPEGRFLFLHMERFFETNGYIHSRKNEARSLLRKCFKNNIFSFVPFEIWKEIVSFAEARTICFLTKTCWGFKELVENIGENNFKLALLFRKESQIILAKKYLLLSANNRNPIAMFHLGFASFHVGGWGLKVDCEGAAEWFKKSAEAGYGPAMALYANCFKWGHGVSKNQNLRNTWGKKALSSNNLFAAGYCYSMTLGTSTDYERACNLYEVLGEEGDEFAQYMLGNLHEYGLGVAKDYERALYWYLKSAENGLVNSQFAAGYLYRDGFGGKVDKEMAISWFKKAAKQGHENASKALAQLL